MDSKVLKKYIVFSVGTLLFGFGISLSNKSLLGGNPMSVLVQGITNILPFSFGTCNLIVGIIQIIIGYICDKKTVTFATFFGTVCGSYAIDLADLLIKDTNTLAIKIIYMILGIILYCLGLALQQVPKCGYTNLDCFIFGLAAVFKIDKYHIIRWIVDIAFLIIGYLLGGIVGIGTVLLFVLSGILIEFFVNTFRKILNYD